MKKKSAVNMGNIPQGDIYFIGRDVCASESGQISQTNGKVGRK